MLFYSAMSLALAGGRLKRNFAFLAIFLAAVAVAGQFSPWNGFKVLANPIFAELAAGAALAALWPRLHTAPLVLGWLMIAAAVVAFGVESHVGFGNVSWKTTLEDTNAWARVVAFGVPGALLVAGAAICERILTGRLVAGAAWLGDASYSLYLSQAFSVPAASPLWFQFLGRSYRGGVVRISDRRRRGGLRVDRAADPERPSQGPLRPPAAGQRPHLEDAPAGLRRWRCAGSGARLADPGSGRSIRRSALASARW